MNDSIDILCDMIKKSDNIVFFGGAGVSTESGVKDYRSEDGIYSTVSEFGVSPEEILSRSFFTKNPRVFYDFYRKYFMTDAEPNDAHKALALLEKAGKIKVVITQNIDSLHQRAGSENVVELHGTARKFKCNYCGAKQDDNEIIHTIMKGLVPRCDSCNTVVKPKVVLYEEMLDEDVTDKAIDAIGKADMLIVGGTSLVVNPAASFIRYFGGKHLVIINKTETPYDSNAGLIIRDSIGVVFKNVVEKLGL